MLCVSHVCHGVSLCVKDGLVLCQAWSKSPWTILMGYLYLTISTNVRRYQTHHRWHFFFQEDSAQVHCVCNTVQLSEKCDFSCFPVLPGSAEAHVIWGACWWHSKAYFLGNICVKNCRNRTVYIKIIASQRWDVFWLPTLSVTFLPKNIKIYSSVPKL